MLKQASYFMKMEEHMLRDSTFILFHWSYYTTQYITIQPTDHTLLCFTFFL
jgi:hypothetical protein